MTHVDHGRGAPVGQRSAQRASHAARGPRCSARRYAGGGHSGERRPGEGLRKRARRQRRRRGQAEREPRKASGRRPDQGSFRVLAQVSAQQVVQHDGDADGGQRAQEDVEASQLDAVAATARDVIRAGGRVPNSRSWRRSPPRDRRRRPRRRGPGALPKVRSRTTTGNNHPKLARRRKAVGKAATNAAPGARCAGG